FPAKAPLRAVIDQRREAASGAPAGWPVRVSGDPLQPYVATLGDAPWTQDLPILLPRGRLASDAKGHAWWRANDGAAALPLANAPSGVARGADLEAAVAIWTGTRARLLAAQTSWGRIDGGA
ncbi:MAG TPA: SWIM zinc finger family protein, partial [Vineibacter sp.]|nr:SWIM zinc finger family protein [Vineibacter sp.]